MIARYPPGNRGAPSRARLSRSHSFGRLCCANCTGPTPSAFRATVLGVVACPRNQCIACRGGFKYNFVTGTTFNGVFDMPVLAVPNCCMAISASIARISATTFFSGPNGACDTPQGTTESDVNCVLQFNEQGFLSTFSIVASIANLYVFAQNLNQTGALVPCAGPFNLSNRLTVCGDNGIVGAPLCAIGHGGTVTLDPVW